MKSKSIVKQPLELALCLILVAIVLITFVQVLFRYIFHLSLAWSEELARYLFLWLAALSAAYAFKTGSHFALRFLVDRMGTKVRGFVQSLVALLVSLFLAIFIWKAVEYTVTMSNQVAPSTQISMLWPYSSAVVGGLLMLYYVLRNWWLEMKGQGEESGSSEAD